MRIIRIYFHTSILALNETGTAPALPLSRRVKLKSPKNILDTGSCGQTISDKVLALNMMNVEGMNEDMVTWVRAIEALPVVSFVLLPICTL